MFPNRELFSSLCLLPSMLANERYELAIPVVFILLSVFGLDHSDQFLRFARLTDWNHQATTNFQLRHQWTGNSRPAGGNENRLVRTMCAPAQRAIESLNRRIVNTKFAYAPLSFSRKFADTFNGVDLRSQSRKN